MLYGVSYLFPDVDFVLKEHISGYIEITIVST